VVLAAGSASAQAAGGVEVQVGGGVVAFPGAAPVDPGAAWAVSAGLSPLPMLGVEVGYQGAAYTAEATGSEESAAGVENGAYGAVKIGPQRLGVAPYALAGLGLSHINAVDERRESGPIRDDMVLRAPLGLGVDVRFDAFRVGLRGSYDFLFLNQFALRTDSARGADQVIGTVRIGAAF
jgi:hypothetical protein